MERAYGERTRLRKIIIVVVGIHKNLGQLDVHNKVFRVFVVDDELGVFEGSCSCCPVKEV